MEEYAKRPKEHLQSELAGVSTRAIKFRWQVPDWAETGQPRFQLETVINNVSIGLMMFSRDMTVDWINETAADMFGFRAHEMLGKVWYDLLPSMESRRPIYEKVMLGEELDFPTAEVSSPDGNRYFDVHYRPIKNSDGTVLGMLTVADEVTENMRAEAALGESESRNRAFLEAIPDMMFHINKEGIILDFKAKEGETYVPPSEFLDKRLYDVLPPNVAQESERLVLETLKTQKMQLHEYQLPLDGKPHNYEARIVSTGENEVLAVVRDVTASKQAEKDLIKIERLQALQTLSAGMSHNLNNILSTVLGPAEIIRGQAESQELREYADMIFDSASRAVDLVRRLHWAVQDGHDEDLSQVNLNEVVQVVVRVAEPGREVSEAPTTEIITDLKNIPQIWATKTGLHMILINLISNAMDAMPDGGKIVIRTRQQGAGVNLTCADTGLGMDGKTSARIFEPFFTTKKDVGSGLGLSTCQKVITGWGGTIKVDSGPGKGTTFALWFPGEPEV